MLESLQNAPDSIWRGMQAERCWAISKEEFLKEDTSALSSECRAVSCLVSV